MRRQLFAVLPLVALSSLLSWLTVEAVNVRAICENGDLDESLMNFCKSLDSFYSPANDLYQWDDDVTDDDDYVFGSSRSRRDASFMSGLRSRRGGNYIRFGRSITDLSDDPSVRRTLLASFGAPARRTSSGHYMRFGRSVDHVTDSQAVEKRFGGDNGKDEDEHSNFVRLARPFMRFGRAGNDDKRAFMRFGRSGRDEEGDAKRAFMRFGRSHLEDDADVKRAFMRFGRAFNSDANSDDENAMLGEIPDKKAFMRFGKRAFMRFGRRTAEDGNEKRFMRFGRKSDDDDDVEDGSPDKRFMRFGKRAFMRFGRGSDDELAGDEMESASKRAFMRFGKRSGTAEDDDDVREKKFMRFGRNGGESEDETGKRFMRFGRNDGTSDASADKRFMRFGKRQQQQQHEETDSARS